MVARSGAITIQLDGPHDMVVPLVPSVSRVAPHARDPPLRKSELQPSRRTGGCADLLDPAGRDTSAIVPKNLDARMKEARELAIRLVDALHALVRRRAGVDQSREARLHLSGLSNSRKGEGRAMEVQRRQNDNGIAVAGDFDHRTPINPDISRRDKPAENRLRREGNDAFVSGERRDPRAGRQQGSAGMARAVGSVPDQPPIKAWDATDGIREPYLEGAGAKNAVQACTGVRGLAGFRRRDWHRCNGQRRKDARDLASEPSHARRSNHSARTSDVSLAACHWPDTRDPSQKRCIRVAVSVH